MCSFKTKFEKLHHCLTMIFFFYKFYDCFSDAGYIAFTVAANRLSVFMEDPLTSDFMEGFVFYLCNHFLYIQNNSRRWLGVYRFFIMLQTRNNKFNQIISPLNNIITHIHVSTNIDNTHTLHRQSQLDNTIQLTYDNIHLLI